MKSTFLSRAEMRRAASGNELSRSEAGLVYPIAGRMISNVVPTPTSLSKLMLPL